MVVTPMVACVDLGQRLIGFGIGREGHIRHSEINSIVPKRFV